MPIDIDDLRVHKGGDPSKARESEKRRFRDPAIVDRILGLDTRWRELRGKADSLRGERGKVSKQIPKFKKEKKDIKPLIAQSNAIKAQIAEAEQEMHKAAADRDALLNTVGNYVHGTVPVFADEHGENGELLNGLVHTHGAEGRRLFPASKLPATEKEALLERNGAPGGGKDGALLRHHELLQRIGGYDPEAGVKVAGSRCYFLRGPGVSLNYALQMYAQNFLVERGYTLLQPPYFMKKEMMAGVAQLAEFDETLYHVSGGDETEEGSAREKYLIATSEQPICGYHKGERFNEADLKKQPLLYGGCSSCFRKEAGKSGADIWGIFRVHQFDKVEQFVICHPEDSWRIHEEMLEQAKTFTESLGLAYRVVNIVSGDLNNAAAKKYDMEAWFPGYDDYREIVSCSNCLDYQSRSMEVKYGQPKDKSKRSQNDADSRKKYVHMLNSTLCACTRLICCILENFQTAEGVVIPEVLLPYLPPSILKVDEQGRKYVPYVQELKKTISGAEKSAKGAAKKKARKAQAQKKNQQKKKGGAAGEAETKAKA